MKTTNDIVREMREFADTDSQSIGRDVLRRRIHKFADLIKKAHEFELAVEKAKAAGEGYAAGKQSVTDCNQHETVDIESRCIYGEVKNTEPVGSSAAMRGVLVTIRKMLVAVYESESDFMRLSHNKPLVDLIDAALSAPPRNCDKCLTPKDAMLAHLEEVYEGEKVEFGDYEWCEFVKWLFAEAKGDTK